MKLTVLQFKTLSGCVRAMVIGTSLLAAQAIVPAMLQPYTNTVLPGLAYAQEDGDKESKPEQKTKRTQAISNKLFEKLQTVQELLEAKEYREAQELLTEMKSGSKQLNDAEMSNVLTMEAFIYYTQENYPKALDAYRQITRLEQANEGAKLQAQYSMAQLYFVTEQYKKGVDALLVWFKAKENSGSPPGAAAHVLLSQGYYQMKDFPNALKHVNIAVDDYKAKGKVPKENWYSLQRFLYYEKNDYKKVVQILDELLNHYPKKAYWMQLSAMYAELRDETRQYNALDTAYVQGMLDKEGELVNMTYLYLANDVPYKAAKTLDKGIKDKIVKPTSKNLELLGNAWRAAQEVKKAIPEMAKAAEKSDKGELWARLGNIYLDNDDYKEAIKAINAGLKKGGVKRPDTAYLVLGMAHYNLKQYDSARKAFKKAEDDDRSRKYARQWMRFMDKELERQRQLEDV